MRFLIVDDDERIREMIKTVVADDSAVFFECGDGAQARASYAAHKPDWVLMDVAMPKMDGLTATRQIKSDDPAARIVIVTAHDSAAVREEAHGAGACSFMLKENLFKLREILAAAA